MAVMYMIVPCTVRSMAQIPISERCDGLHALWHLACTGQPRNQARSGNGLDWTIDGVHTVLGDWIQSKIGQEANLQQTNHTRRHTRGTLLGGCYGQCNRSRASAPSKQTPSFARRQSNTDNRCHNHSLRGSPFSFRPAAIHLSLPHRLLTETVAGLAMDPTQLRAMTSPPCPPGRTGPTPPSTAAG